LNVQQNVFTLKLKKKPNGEGVEVWVKPMTPIINGEHSYAIVYFNTNIGHNSKYVSI
jgi:hypothetical protein